MDHFRLVQVARIFTTRKAVKGRKTTDKRACGSAEGIVTGLAFYDSVMM